MGAEMSEVAKISELNHGAAVELFESEFKRILNNLADEDTSWKTQREVSIKVKIRLTSEERSAAITTVDVQSKVAPPKPHESTIQLDHDGRGNVQAYQRESDPNQPELDSIHEFEREAK